ncbi:MAG TPA: hypothetical protein VMV46_05895 [Thermoanaerobaculia bacterium]|nr:hypothetical protein [Thermoanaerobaculia bacterium]
MNRPPRRRRLPHLLAPGLAWSALALGLGLALSPPAPAHVRITTNITWSEEIRPILRDHCMRCHRPGGIAPSYADFTTYGTDSQPGARAWATAIEEEILTGRMPPWDADGRYGDFANPRRLSQRETDMIVAWVQGGAPQGPRRNLPPPPELTEEWLYGEPDLVVRSAEPYELRGGQMEGSVRWEIPVDVPADTWITGFELRPDNPQAVHRMAAWIHDGDAPPERLEVEIQVPYDPFRDEDEPEPTRRREMPHGRRFLGQYLRGDAPVLLPDGAGRRLRPGATIELQVDYRRRALEGTDRPLLDRSALGLYLARSAEEVDLVAEALALGDDTFEVSRKVARKGATVQTTLAEDVRLVGISPHVGALVEGLEVRARYPDGRDKTLLLVPEVRSEWPASFRFAEPLDAPQGTRLEMIGRFAEPAAKRVEQPFALWVDYTLDDHLVLPEILEPRDPAEQASRGSMLVGAFEPGLAGKAPGDLGEGGVTSPFDPADPNAAAHMDHSPLHGGQFFMAPNMYHHLEGALYEGNVFRVFVYDDFKEPVDPRNFAARIVVEHYDRESGEFTEEEFPMAPVVGTDHLEGALDTELPAEFYAAVWLAGEEQRFDFYFDEYSQDVPAAPRVVAGLPGTAEHGHERPPLDIPEDPLATVRELVTRSRRVAEKIEQGDWLFLYVPAFDGRDLAEALLGKLDGLAARDRGRARKAVSRVLQSAAELDRAGDLGDEGRARQALSRFDDAVREIVLAFGG